MTTPRLWKLKHEDGRIEDFIDIRRKVGNRVLRSYLLDAVLESKKTESMKASLRGPKDEFQDFANFLILRANENGEEFRFLVEAGVYENLRIVGTDNQKIADTEPDALEKLFTKALQSPDEFCSSIVISFDSKLKMK